jgi:hypothetical protein
MAVLIACTADAAGLQDGVVDDFVSIGDVTAEHILVITPRPPVASATRRPSPFAAGVEVHGVGADVDRVVAGQLGVISGSAEWAVSFWAGRPGGSGHPPITSSASWSRSGPPPWSAIPATGPRSPEPSTGRRTDSGSSSTRRTCSCPGFSTWCGKLLREPSLPPLADEEIATRPPGG